MRVATAVSLWKASNVACFTEEIHSSLWSRYVAWPDTVLHNEKQTVGSQTRDNADQNPGCFCSLCLTFLAHSSWCYVMCAACSTTPCVDIPCVLAGPGGACWFWVSVSPGTLAGLMKHTGKDRKIWWTTSNHKLGRENGTHYGWKQHNGHNTEVHKHICEAIQTAHNRAW